MSKFFGSWGSYQGFVEDVLGSEYDHETGKSGPRVPPKDFPPEDRVLFACYDTAPYEGSATVLYLDADGSLLEYADSHCSCRGLEWGRGGSPVTWDALAMRPPPDAYSGYNLEAHEALLKLVAEHATPAAKS
jgi:hypothetical protein